MPSCHPPGQGQHYQPEPELEGVGYGAQRADVFAPEAVDEQAQENHYRHRSDGHPKDNLPLEAGGDCIVRVQLLAEKLAGAYGHIHNPEKEAIFDQPEDDIQRLADPDGFDFHRLARTDEQVLYSPHRAEIAAEELAEENHRHRQRYAHQNLERTHRAREGAPLKVGRQGLQTSEGTQFFGVGGRHPLENLTGEAAQKENKQSHRAPLKEILRPVGAFLFHILI